MFYKLSSVKRLIGCPLRLDNPYPGQGSLMVKSYDKVTAINRIPHADFQLSNP